MCRGDHATAWAISDAVLAARDPGTRDDPRLPYHLRWVWDGRPWRGRDVLVRCYHGLGDTLQFARFLPELRPLVASLTLEVQPALLPLLAGVPGIDRLVPFDPAAPLPPAGCDVEVMELSHLLRLPPEAVPPLALPVRPAAVPAGAIGLCWRAGDWDPDRSVPEALMQALAAGIMAATPSPAPARRSDSRPPAAPMSPAGTCPPPARSCDSSPALSRPALSRPAMSRPAMGWTAPTAPVTPPDAPRSAEPGLDPAPPAKTAPPPLFSLQFGATSLPVRNPAGAPAALAATAALVAGLARVVTVDSMIAHLAGCLGRPAWLLLKHEADWRWMADRTDSPWYPQARLFRQPGPGDWATPLRQVARALKGEALREAD